MSADQLDAIKAMVNEFSSHIGDEYTGTAATLMKNIDARYAQIEQETADAALAGPDEQQEIKQEQEHEPSQEQTEEPSQEATDNNKEENAPSAEDNISIMDEKDAAFLESINDENKQQIIDRYNRLDDIANDLGDVFDLDKNPYSVKYSGFSFEGLKSFYDNVYIDQDIPEDPDEKPSEELRNKRDWLKDEVQTLALNLSLKDLVQDESIDGITDKDELRKRLAESVHDNMTFLTYHLGNTQAAFEAMSEGKNLSNILPKDRHDFVTAMHDKSSNAAQAITGILAGTNKAAVQLSTPTITNTFAPHHKECESFATKFKEKTGIGKLWNRVKAFDDKMTQNHKYLWGFAKSMGVRYVTGPAGVAAMVGYSTYKQCKILQQEYIKQKAENNGQMNFWDFVKKNPGKIAATAVASVATGIASYTGIDAALGGDFGAIGNITGAILSGDAPNALSQLGSLSFQNLVNSGKNLIHQISNTQGIDLQPVADSIKNSWTPTRTLRSVMSLGAGFTQASEAAMKAEAGNKWKTFRKVFTGTITGLAVGSVLADATNAAEQIIHSQPLDMMAQDIAATQQSLQQELSVMNADSSNLNLPLPPDYTVDGGEKPELVVTGHHHIHTAQIDQPTEKINITELHPTSVIHEPEVKAPDLEVKQAFDVNGEQVFATQGNSLEETLDNARQEYLDSHPEVDDAKNTVKIEGHNVEAKIHTEKEDIMSQDGAAVLGQEKEVDRTIKVGEDIKIKDHIESTVTETGKVETMETTGRVDADTHNNIPDGAKILGTYHFENDNQNLSYTVYEDENGNRMITDGVNSREFKQNLDDMNTTASAMLKETAEVAYQESQHQVQNPGQEQAAPEVRVVQEQTQEQAAPEVRVVQNQPQEQAAPAVKVVQEQTQEQAAPAVKVVQEQTQEQAAPVTRGEQVTSGNTTDHASLQPEAVANFETHGISNGVEYSFSEDGKFSFRAQFNGHNEGVLNNQYIKHLMPEYEKGGSTQQFTDNQETVRPFYKGDDGLYHCGGSVNADVNDAIAQEQVALKNIVALNEVYNDLQNQAETRDLSLAEQKFMQAHEKLLEGRGLVNNSEGVLEYKDCPKEQHYDFAQQKEEILRREQEAELEATPPVVENNVADPVVEPVVEDNVAKPVAENNTTEQVVENHVMEQVAEPVANNSQYQFDENGNLMNLNQLSVSAPGVSDSRYIEHLMPEYKNENSSTQVFNSHHSVSNTTYTDSKGLVHCGGSVGTIKDAVVMQERAVLEIIVKENAVYNDLQSQAETRDLSSEEQKFMQTHEKMLADRGLVNNKDGVLEYKDCPKEQYCHRVHDQVAIKENDSSACDRMEARAHEAGIKGNVTTHIGDNQAVSVGNNGMQITNDKGVTQTYIITKEGVMTGNPYNMKPVTDIEQLNHLKQEAMKTVGEDHKFIKNLSDRIEGERMQQLSGRSSGGNTSHTSTSSSRSYSPRSQSGRDY